MVVVGATAPEEARAARKILPHAPFLVPGYGAQGASAADAMAAAVKGEKGPEGVLVNASRAVLYPDAAKDAVDINAWRAAIETAIDAAQAELKAAG
jgi:orotidine-5'-phosphate decarboxylase